MSNRPASVPALMVGLSAALLAVLAFQPAAAATNNTTTRSNTQHNVTGAYDPSHGHPVGRRQHRPLVITREVDKATPLMAAPHGASAGKRRHQPLTIHRTVDSASPK